MLVASHGRIFLLAGIAWIAAALTVQAIGAQTGQDIKRTVWDGVFTEAQAQRGRIQYVQACASCHAEDLRGRSTAPSLVEESFAFQWDDMSVGDLFIRTRTLMPSDRPNSLPNESYRDIIAFILQSNKFPPGDRELDADPDALKQILIATKRPEK